VAEDKSKQAKRNNHFTPVVYLQNFTDANRLLHVVSLLNGKRFTYCGPLSVNTSSGAPKLAIAAASTSRTNAPPALAHSP
jgi:hypothetical protein